ncbi:MAG: hypothetical protein ACKVIF_00915, partial [Rhodospirillales bacterium]
LNRRIPGCLWIIKLKLCLIGMATKADFDVTAVIYSKLTAGLRDGEGMPTSSLKFSRRLNTGRSHKVLAICMMWHLYPLSIETCSALPYRLTVSGV